MTPELVLPAALAALVAHGHVTVLGDQPAVTVPCKTCGGTGRQWQPTRNGGAVRGQCFDCGGDGCHSYSGPVTLRAGTELPRIGSRIGQWQVIPGIPGALHLWNVNPPPLNFPLRQGEVVGTADIEQVPIFKTLDMKRPLPYMWLGAMTLQLLTEAGATDISDAFAYSTFTPGGTATMFTNVRTS